MHTDLYRFSTKSVVSASDWLRQSGREKGTLTSYKQTPHFFFFFLKIFHSLFLTEGLINTT